MYDVSDEYIKMMNAGVRKPSYMKIIFSFEDGDVTFTNDDIVSFEESKTAHLVAGELPTIEASIELKNLTGLFDGDDETNDPNYHDQIVEGVKVIYYFGYQGKSRVKPYGYDGDSSDTYDPVYGMSDSGTPQYTYYTDDGYETIPAEAYGFADGYDIVWIKGGEVYTDGDIEFDESAITATISAYDALSVLSDTVYYSFSGSTTLGEIAENVIGLTDYPEDDNGDKKIIIGDELYDISTSISVAGSSSDATSAKEWLQDLAYAGCVQMYIDRDGYLHLDKDQEEISPSQYTLYAFNQSENPSYYKYQLPSTLTIELDTDYGTDIEVNVGGGGEELVISDNPYIVTTTSGERLEDRLVDNFIPYRNEADITYRGEPALDILDRITFEKSTGTTLTGTIIESTLTYDGGISGTLLIRYASDSTTPSVKIKGGDMFYYPVGSDTPTVDDITLTCNTTAEGATYQWYYFDSGKWYTIDNTTTILIIGYNDSYFDDSDSVKFKCIVNNYLGAYTTVSKYYYEEVAEAGYKGEVEGTTVEDIKEVIEKPVVGDVVLLDNTADVEAEEYGKVYVYNGDTWVVTEDSSYLSDVYKDALELASQSGETIYSAKIYTDLLVANDAFISSLSADEAFITNLMTNNLLIEEGGSIHSDYYNADGSPNLNSTSLTGVYMDASGRFKAYNCSLLGTLKTGENAPCDARIGIQDESGVGEITFSGTGLNDLYIVEDDEIAGEFIAKITTTNSLLNLGKDGSFVSNGNMGDLMYISEDNIAVNSVGTMVACSSRLIYSTDGVNWEFCNTPIDSVRWERVAVNSDGVFVANRYGDSQWGYSTDGINWSLTPSNIDFSIIIIGATSTGRFVAISSNGSNLKYSDDNGVTWSDEVATSLSHGIEDIVTDSTGKMIGVGYQMIAQSTDGITWTEISQTLTSQLQCITVNSTGRFVALGKYSAILYSDDGITWNTPSTYPSGRTYLSVVATSSDTFVGVTDEGYVVYSDDGVVWDEFLLADTSLRSIALRSDDVLVVAGESGITYTASPQDIVSYSTDNGATFINPTHIPATTKKVSISDYGIIIGFSQSNGHTLDDSWSFEQKTMKAMRITDAVGDEYMSVTDGWLTIKNVDADYIDVDTVDIDTSTTTLANITKSYTQYVFPNKDDPVDVTQNDNISIRCNDTQLGAGNASFAYGFVWDLYSNDIYSNYLHLKTPTSMTHTTSGGRYVVMSNGLIIQWGRTSIAENTSQTKTFPISFTSHGSLVASSGWDSASGWAKCGGRYLTTETFNLFNVDDTTDVNWIAVGY